MEFESSRGWGLTGCVAVELAIALLLDIGAAIQKKQLLKLVQPRPHYQLRQCLKRVDSITTNEPADRGKTCTIQLAINQSDHLSLSIFLSLFLSLALFSLTSTLLSPSHIFSLPRFHYPPPPPLLFLSLELLTCQSYQLTVSQ